MPLSADERKEIAAAFNAAMETIDHFVQVYCAKVGAPERFALSVFDASGGGSSYLEGGDPEARAIVEHQIRTADWGDRNFSETARRKTRAALRLGRDSGDVARNAKELFQEGDAPNPGACLAEVNGKQICVAGSGLRGQEDEAFALLTIELLKRALTPPA